MKYLTIESFINSLPEEDIWKIIEDYEKWRETGEDGNSLLRNKAREFCSNLTLPAHYHSDWMPKIAMGAYRHFALKYMEDGTTGHLNIFRNCGKINTRYEEWKE